MLRSSPKNTELFKSVHAFLRRLFLVAFYREKTWLLVKFKRGAQILLHPSCSGALKKTWTCLLHGRAHQSNCACTRRRPTFMRVTVYESSAQTLEGVFQRKVVHI